ncbi:hypothetical protein [Clostridium sp. UBA1652]|uniref:hypothetical protein n=1 Tax=Clostridium sp. UBA1652 TaxID=1946348 RepID=UPI00257DA0D7|nr:hypothetical protein [Clostridium sp. UBA1652]
MNDDILRKVENHLNVTEVKQGAEMLKEYVPSIVSMNKDMYEEMKKQGFTDEQAFKFSCQYTLKMVFQGGEK